MIDLITGLPGNAKTLFTIAHVKAWSERENRPVFYSGIPELTLPWTQIEPEKWMDCPPGSIVVIDECQRVFRNRSINSQPPPFVTELETHRHKGIDLVFITQHPMLIDPAVRRLTGRHRHLVRIYGMAASTVHEWNAVRENCDKPVARRDSEKKKWVFDKTIYRLYKSAEQHTGKVAIPFRLKLLLVLPLLLGAAVWYMYSFVQKRTTAPQVAPSQVVTAPGQVVGAPAGARPPGGDQVRPFDPVADARTYAEMSTARVVGLPHTAPKYDEITRPTTAPVPAACVSMKDKCNCYSQQGTLMAVPEALCLDIVHRGYFLEFDPNRDQGSKHEERVVQSKAVLDSQERLPISGASTTDVGRDGFGVLGKAGPGVRQPGA